MMDWDTYATLLDIEQTKRAENNEPPLFGENQEELSYRSQCQSSGIQVLQSNQSHGHHRIPELFG